MILRTGLHGHGGPGVIPASAMGGGAAVMVPKYHEKVLSYGPIAYWPLWELLGTVAQCLVNPAQNGAYTGVTLGQPGIGDGNTAPFFDGASDFVDVVGVQPVFAPDESTLAIWLKVNAIGVWTDGGNRYAVSFWTVKQYAIWKADVANTLSLRANQQINHTTTDTDWIFAAFTRSVSAGVDGEFKAYINGVQTGVTTTGLAAWGSTTFLAGWHTLGAANTGGAASFHGWLAHAQMYGSALPQPSIADLAVV